MTAPAPPSLGAPSTPRDVGPFDYDRIDDRVTVASEWARRLKLPDHPMPMGAWLSGVAPSHRDQVATALREAPDPFVVAFRPAHGPPEPLEVFGRRTERGLSGVLRTAEAEGFHRAVLDLSHVGIYVYDVVRRENRWLNAAYTSLTGHTLESFAAPDAPPLHELFHPDDLPAVLDHMSQVMAAPDGVVVSLEYRFRRADGEWRWLLSRDRVFRRDPSGAVCEFLGTFVDITEQKCAQQRLEAQRLDLTAQLAELETLYREAPMGLAMLDRDLRFVRINDALAEINGAPAEAHVGKRVWDLVPDLKSSAEPLLLRVLEGEALRDVPIAGETPARPKELRHWREQFYPLRGADGETCGVGVVCEEVTQQVQDEAHREALIRELSHRVRNTMAVVQSLARQSLRRADLVEPREDFQARLRTLAHAHELLTASQWRSCSLDDLLARAWRVACDQPHRMQAAGPEVSFGPRASVTVAMALHELCTNAVKYGALSVPEGRVSVRWSIVGPDRFVLDWQEEGGPTIASVAPPGFGTRMLQEVLAAELRGTVQLSYPASGLICRFEGRYAHDEG